MQKDNKAKSCARAMGQECIAMRIRLISRAISRIYDETLRPHGLKGSQISILAVVSGLGQAEPAKVCRILHLDASTLSRNVTRMRTNGWLKASPRGDRRSHRIELTPEGERILVDAFPAWNAAQEKVSRILGEDNTAAIRRLAEDLWNQPGRG